MAAHVAGVWGIDLGQCAVKAIRLEMKDGQVTATHFDYIEYPKILSQPDADPDQLIREALEQFLSRNKLRGDKMVISVPGQSGLARFVKLPPVEEKKIADIVRFEAKQQIPFPLDEVVWDFQRIGSGQVTDGFAMETEIGLFAIKRDMVFRYIQHFKDVNVEVHIVQMAPLALCNYVAYNQVDKTPSDGEAADAPKAAGAKKKCVVALDIGTDNSNLVVTDGEKIIWQRPIPLGGNHFTRVLTKDLKLTFAKAEHLKRNAVKSPDLRKILSSLRTVLNDFVGELQRSLGYFANTHRDAQIQFMVGVGNAFKLPGLQKFLQEKLQLEVRKMTGLEKLTGEEVLSAPTFIENLPSFAVAYGLALQGIDQSLLRTNLLPYEIKVERIVRGKKPWAVTAASVLLLALAGLTFARSMEKAEIEDPAITIARKKALDVAKKKTDYDGQFAAKQKEIDDDIRAVKLMAAGVEERFNWQRLHEFINMALPQPNGLKLPKVTSMHVEAERKYKTASAMEAFAKLEKKRFAKFRVPMAAAKAAEEDEFIKKHLIQVNLESISTMYSDDLSPYFQKIFQDTPLLRGMSNMERQQVVNFAKSNEKGSMPTSGWVVEIRGYTYHEKEFDFVDETFVENLNYPERVPENQAILKSPLGGEIMDRIKGKMSYLFIYKHERVHDPEPGVFPVISNSYLPALIAGTATGGGMGMMGGGAAAGKDAAAPPAGGGGGPPGMMGGGKAPVNWAPIGSKGGGGGGLGMGIGGRAGPMDGGFKGGTPAMPFGGPAIGGGPAIPGGPGGQASGGAPKGNRQPRTEFVLLAVWQEPFLGQGAPGADGAPPAGAAPAAPPPPAGKQ